MVCGIDIYRDKATKKMAAGVVASVNKAFSRFHSRAVFDPAGPALAAAATAFELAIAEAIGQACKVWAEANGGQWPGQVVVYRDGVTTGQFSSTRREAGAVANTVEALALEAGNAATNVTYVQVQKKIPSRLYTPGAKAENPPPGVVLDHTVTLRDWYDFYIVPMQVSRGTVTPVHYVVVRDPQTLKPDHLQRMTYALSHMYFNWTGHVKVPAVCQYAHKLIELVGEHLHKEPREELADKLYYL